MSNFLSRIHRQEIYGIGLRYENFGDLLNNNFKEIDFLEIHAENYYTNSENRKFLQKIRANYDLSIHAVNLSLCSADGVDEKALLEFRKLVNELDPILISDHLSFSRIENTYLNDLLPIPLNEESFEITKTNINKVQDFLKREILIENPTFYFEFKSSNILEEEFLTKLAISTGCKILLDINNVFVNSFNHKINPKSYIDYIDDIHVGEIHIAGHQKNNLGDGKEIIIDTHDNYPCKEVIELMNYYFEKKNIKPILFEWDKNLPKTEAMIEEIIKFKESYNRIYNKTNA